MSSGNPGQVFDLQSQATAPPQAPIPDPAAAGEVNPQLQGQAESSGGAARIQQPAPAAVLVPIRMRLGSITATPKGGDDKEDNTADADDSDAYDAADIDEATGRLFGIDSTPLSANPKPKPLASIVSAADRERAKARAQRQKEINERLEADLNSLQAVQKQTQDRINRAAEEMKELARDFGAPAVDVKRQVQFEDAADPLPSSSNTIASSSSSSIATPPRLYPNLNPAARATTPRTVNRGRQLDLDQLSALLGNQYMKATADKPPKFGGQPPLGREQYEKQADGSSRRKLNWIQWRNAVDLWFTMTGIKQESMRFVYALSMLEGAAQVLANNLTAAEPDPIRTQIELSDGSLAYVTVQPQTWSWLKEKLTRHYMPANYDQLLRNELRGCQQRSAESVASYYTRFTNLTSQLAQSMDFEQQFNDFRNGLGNDNKKRVDDVMRMRSNLGLTGAFGPTGVMTVEQMLDICQRGELEEQHNQKLLAQKNPHTTASSSSSYSKGKAAYQGNSQGGKKPGQYQHPNRFSALNNLESSSSGIEGDESDQTGTDEDGKAEGHEPGDREGELNAIGSKAAAAAGAYSANKSKPIAKPASPAQQAAAAGKQCWICGGTGHFKKQCPIWLSRNGNAAAATKVQGNA